jgi:hypothetical protein
LGVVPGGHYPCRRPKPATPRSHAVARPLFRPGVSWFRRPPKCWAQGEGTARWLPRALRRYVKGLVIAPGRSRRGRPGCPGSDPHGPMVRSDFSSRRTVKQSQSSLQAVWRPFSPPGGVLCTFPSWYLYAIGFRQLYLALEGSYLLLQPALSSRPTLRLTGTGTASGVTGL